MSQFPPLIFKRSYFSCLFSLLSLSLDTLPFISSLVYKSLAFFLSLLPFFPFFPKICWSFFLLVRLVLFFLFLLFFSLYIYFFSFFFFFFSGLFFYWSVPISMVFRVLFKDFYFPFIFRHWSVCRIFSLILFPLFVVFMCHTFPYSLLTCGFLFIYFLCFYMFLVFY